MNYAFRKTIVIALGGSIVFPDQIDTKFLKAFKKFLAPFLKRKIKFVLVVGGGRLARVFQNAAQKVSALTNEDKDWIGIHSTRLNAHLLRTIFREVADPVVFDARGKIKKLEYPVTIASGWRPGWSTDFVAAAIAKDLGANEFIVAGKPAYVYPHTKRESDRSRRQGRNSRYGVGVYHKDSILDKTHPFETISWKSYCKLIPTKWIPGSHAPVDPVAARLSHHAKIKAIIINGKDLKNLGQLLNGKEFRGTIIE